MRYIKKLSLYRNDPVSNKFAVLQDQRIVTNSTASIQVPVGTTVQRPNVSGPAYDGMIRYNSTINEFEVYNYENPGFGRWEPLRTVRQAVISPQNLGTGTYNNSVFGPLSYDVDVTKPQNVFVFVENVYQVPEINYSLIANPANSSGLLTHTTASGVTTLYLNTVTNIDRGNVNGQWRTVTASVPGIQPTTTVTSISLTYNYEFGGYPLEISLPTTNTISIGSTISVSYNAGTYIQFTGPVPSRPVLALLGVDGYWPIPTPPVPDPIVLVP